MDERRFDAATVAALQALRGWGWDPGRIARSLPAIRRVDLQALAA